MITITDEDDIYLKGKDICTLFDAGFKTYIASGYCQKVVSRSFVGISQYSLGSEIVVVPNQSDLANKHTSFGRWGLFKKGRDTELLPISPNVITSEMLRRGVGKPTLADNGRPISNEDWVQVFIPHKKDSKFSVTDMYYIYSYDACVNGCTSKNISLNRVDVYNSEYNASDNCTRVSEEYIHNVKLDYESKIRSLESKVQRMSDQISSYSTELDRQKCKVSDLKIYVDELKEELESAESKCSDLEEELKEAKDIGSKIDILRQEYVSDIDKVISDTNKITSEQSNRFKLELEAIKQMYDRSLIRMESIYKRKLSIERAINRSSKCSQYITMKRSYHWSIQWLLVEVDVVLKNLEKIVELKLDKFRLKYRLMILEYSKQWELSEADISNLALDSGRFRQEVKDILDLDFPDTLDVPHLNKSTNNSTNDDELTEEELMDKYKYVPGSVPPGAAVSSETKGKRLPKVSKEESIQVLSKVSKRIK